MQITDIRIRKNAKEGTLKALVSIVGDDAIVVHDIKVLEGKNGLFIAMPSRKSDKGFIDFVHPINTETRNFMQDAILAEYNKEENQANE